MDISGSDDQGIEALLDLLVYAPLGLAMELSARFPEYAARGRSTVESQVGTARFIGEFAVKQATRQVRQCADRGRGSKTEAPPAAAEPVSPVVSPVVVPSAPTGAVVAPGDLPLADYDRLAAAQILPRLVGLTADELDAVRRYELAHRARKTVLGKIEQLSSQ
ncbi:MAG: hypothetical protein JWL70_3004 [Acidimicrobiia bacterium]|nr:hypothetical protein [Acidimicrobiia bacterium]